jgi:hypothetical protein
MTFDIANAALDPGFFNGRFMVEIREWDWHFHLSLSHPKVPKTYRFQGGLNYSRGVEIIGRVRAPNPLRGKLMRIWLSPFGPEIKFGAGGIDRVGQFYRDRPDAIGCDFEASLQLPADALPPAITCLSSVWRYLDIWIDKYEGDEASVTAFSFSANIHPNLKDWAGADLDSSLG